MSERDEAIQNAVAKQLEEASKMKRDIECRVAKLTRDLKKAKKEAKNKIKHRLESEYESNLSKLKEQNRETWEQVIYKRFALL